MKGSYRVATGSSRSPLMACDSPSADIRMNRFISAMPSSICCPFGEASQLKVDGIFSLRNKSAFSARANSPRRLTQAPRLVETVTSGEAVTMREASSVSPRASSLSTRPKPCWVDICGDGVNESRSGTSISGAARRRLPSRLNGASRRKRLQRRRILRKSLELLPLVAGPDVLRDTPFLHLRNRHQAGMVVLVTLERQSDTLDGVGDEADGAIVIDRLERLAHARHVVAAEIGHQLQELVVAAPLDQLRDLPLVADLVAQMLAERGPALETQAPRRAGSDRHRSSASAPRRPARRRRRASIFRISRSPRPSRNCGTWIRISPTALRAPRRRDSGGCNRPPTRCCAARASNPPTMPRRYCPRPSRRRRPAQSSAPRADPWPSHAP